MNKPVDPCAGPGLWSIETAFEAIVGSADPIGGAETVPLRAAVGRVTAEGAASRIPLPRFDQSAMDGYGLHVEDVAAGRLGPFSVSGTILAGQAGGRGPRPGSVVRLLTGAPLPPDVAGVVMEERVHRSAAGVLLGQVPVVGENVRRRGEDVPAGSTIVPAGVRLDARHIAILAAAGCPSVSVRRPVRVGVLSSGDELADHGEPLGPGAVYDSNRPMLVALLAAPHTEVEDLGHVPDDLGRMARFLAGVQADYDLVVTSGGVSGGDADFTIGAVHQAGGSSARIALAMKPGKPFAFGRIEACRMLSLAGNPVAAIVGALLFARPLIRRLAGGGADRPRGLAAVARSAFHHHPGRTEFVPVAVKGQTPDGLPCIEKLGKGGSARLAPLVAADGLAEVPATAADLLQGSRVPFHPFAADFAL